MTNAISAKPIACQKRRWRSGGSSISREFAAIPGKLGPAFAGTTPLLHFCEDGLGLVEPGETDLRIDRLLEMSLGFFHVPLAVEGHPEMVLIRGGLRRRRRRFLE